jgi:hypothetical protein
MAVARALYEREATAAELAAFGLKPSDYAGVVWYWPDTRQAVDLFSRVRTQWRIGLNGATGLSYGDICPLMDRMRLSEDDWDALFADLQLMEQEALDAMYPATE